MKSAELIGGGHARVISTRHSASLTFGGNSLAFVSVGRGHLIPPWREAGGASLKCFCHFLSGDYLYVINGAPIYLVFQKNIQKHI